MVAVLYEGGSTPRYSHALTWRVFQEESAPTWRVFPARPALHNIPKFTKFPNITILLNKLIVTTMHPL